MRMCVWTQPELDRDKWNPRSHLSAAGEIAYGRERGQERGHGHAPSFASDATRPCPLSSAPRPSHPARHREGGEGEEAGHPARRGTARRRQDGRRPPALCPAHGVRGPVGDQPATSSPPLSPSLSPQPLIPRSMSTISSRASPVSHPLTSGSAQAQIPALAQSASDMGVEIWCGVSLPCPSCEIARARRRHGRYEGHVPAPLPSSRRVGSFPCARLPPSAFGATGMCGHQSDFEGKGWTQGATALLPNAQRALTLRCRHQGRDPRPEA